MTLPIRKIDRTFLSSTLWVQIIVSVTAGFSSYFWGLISGSEDVIYAQKAYLRAQTTQIAIEREKSEGGGERIIERPVTVILLNDHDRGYENVSDRQKLADILEAVHSYDPAAVGLDFYFEETYGEEELDSLSPKDTRFLETIERYKQETVVGMRLVETSSGLARPETPFFSLVENAASQFGVINAAYDLASKKDYWYKTRLAFPRAPWFLGGSQTSEKEELYCSLPLALFLLSKANDVENPCQTAGGVKKGLTEIGAPYFAGNLQGQVFIDYNKIYNRYDYQVLTWSEIKNFTKSRYQQSVYFAEQNISPADLSRRRELVAQGLLVRRDGRYYISPEIKTTSELEAKLGGGASGTHEAIRNHWKMFLEGWPGNLIRGKSVLIGSEYSDAGLHNTPLTRHTKLRERDVFIHARILSMLYDNRAIYAASSSVNFMLLIFNLALIFFYTFLIRNARIIYYLFFGHFALYIALNYFLFVYFAIQFEMAAFVMGSLIVAALTLRLRTYYTEKELTPAETALAKYATPALQKELYHRMKPEDEGRWSTLGRYGPLPLLAIRISAARERITWERGDAQSTNSPPPFDSSMLIDKVAFHIREILAHRDALVIPSKKGDSLFCIWNLPVKGNDDSQAIWDCAAAIDALNKELPQRWQESLGLAPEFKPEIRIETLYHKGEIVATISGGRNDPTLAVASEALTFFEDTVLSAKGAVDRGAKASHLYVSHLAAQDENFYKAPGCRLLPIEAEGGAQELNSLRVGLKKAEFEAT